MRWDRDVASGAGWGHAAGLQESEHVVVVPLRHRLPAGDPGEQVVVALFEQRLVAVELHGAQRREVTRGEGTEQQVALQAASITALIEQALAADGDGLGHDGVRGVHTAAGRWAT